MRAPGSSGTAVTAIGGAGGGGRSGAPPSSRTSDGGGDDHVGLRIRAALASSSQWTPRRPCCGPRLPTHASATRIGAFMARSSAARRLVERLRRSPALVDRRSGRASGGRSGTSSTSGDDPGPVLVGDPMPGARWFPDARSTGPSTACAWTAATTMTWSSSDDRRRASGSTLTADELRDAWRVPGPGWQRLGVGPGDRVAAYLPNVPEAAHRPAGHRFAGSDLDELRARVRDPQRRRSAGPGRAEGAPHRRRLSLWRREAVDRRERGGRRSARAAQPGARRSSSPTSMRRGRRIPDAVSWAELTAEPATAGIRSGLVRPSAVRPLQLGHHRAAEADRPRPRRASCSSISRCSACSTTSGRRSVLLVQHDRLDDVELPRVGSRGRRHHRAASTARRPTPTSALSGAWRPRRSVTYFGTSAPFLMACRNDGLRPGEHRGPVAPPRDRFDRRPAAGEGFRYVDDAVSPTVHLESVSGGTDVCTAFVGGVAARAGLGG